MVPLFLVRVCNVLRATLLAWLIPQLILIEGGKNG